MKAKRLFQLVLFSLSFTILSCGDDNETVSPEEQLQPPGDVVAGAVGCSEEQKSNIEDIPGMGNIVSTTLGENGTYIYSDSQGNSCTLDKDGNMEMTGKDGSSVSRDHTIYQSPSAQATELTGKILTGTTDEDDIYYPIGMEFNLQSILWQIPEASAVIEVKSKKTPSSDTEESKYDSIAIAFQNEICIYEKIKKHETATHTYNIEELDYTAHDGYFEWKSMKMHLKIDENGAVRLYFTRPEYNPETNHWEDIDDQTFQINYRDVCYKEYHTTQKSDYRTNYEYKCDPPVSDYYNYTILNNGDVKLTNMRKAILLEKESKKYYEDNDEEIKFELISATENDDEDKDDDEDDEIVIDPSPR